MPPPLGIGIIGCGRVTEYHHVPALHELETARVVALCDLDEVCLRRVGDRFGIASRYQDYRGLLENPAIEAVAICVPAKHHAELALAALDAGKHVFIEKPLALTLEDADRIIGRANGLGLSTAVGFNLRAHRHVQRGRKIVRSGTLGRIELVRSVWTAGLRHRMALPAWRHRRSTGGGVLFEMGVHHFDLWRHLLGEEVTSIAASTRQEPYEDEAAVVLASLTGGIPVSSAFSQGTSDSNEIEIFGDAGRLRISLYRVDGLEVFSLTQLAGGIRERLHGALRQARELPRAIAIARRGGIYIESFSRQWEMFTRGISGETLGQHDLASLDDGRRALEVVLSAARAADRASPVDLPPAVHPRQPALPRAGASRS